MTNKELFTIERLRCSYDRPYSEGRSKVVLHIERLRLHYGQKVFVVGESGIGKSTILETLGLMNNTIVPDAATRFVFHDFQGNATDLCALWNAGDRRLSDFRRRNYSFIFQNTNLMRNFTAYENVAYTRMLQGYTREECFEGTRKVLDRLGLHHVDRRRMAQELSGGQQQRLAFARAILPDFTVLFGDEPTGNLDQENARRVMQIIVERLDAQQSAAAIIVSHDMHLATTFADVIIKIRKQARTRKHAEDEETYYGVIDDACVFTHNGDRTSWGNDNGSMAADAFEDFLRKT